MDATRHIVRALVGASRAIQANTGISGAQLFVLRQLAGSSEPLSVNQLADLTLTHQSTVSSRDSSNDGWSRERHRRTMRDASRSRSLRADVHWPRTRLPLCRRNSSAASRA
jgi:hypothetical protein